VRVVENHALPLVAVRGFVEGGTLLDPRGKEGLFTLDTLLLRDGTSSRTGEQLGDAVAEVGAPFDAFDPTRRFSPFRFTSVSSEFEQSLALMGDMVMHPSFPQAAVDRRKTQVSSGLQRLEGVASAIALRIFNKRLWGADHPFALAASPATIGGITRDDVVRFHDTYVRPQNLTLTIVGDVTPAAAMAAVTKVFGGWQRTAARVAVNVPPPPTPAATTIYLFDRPNSPQSTVFMGQTSPSRSAPDFYALEAMGALFGGPTGSRLTMALRERRPLTYAIVHIPLWRRAKDPASIHGSSNVDATKTDSAVAAWFEELKGLAGARPITDAELSFARAATAGGLTTRIETIDEVANRLNIVARDALAPTYYDDYFRGINRTTVPEITAAAARTIDPARTVIVVVGDRKLVEGGLRALGIGPVVIVDEQGRALP
jgi:zinc protease